MFAHLLLLFQLFTNELPSPLSEARQRIEQAAGDLAFGYRQVELLTTDRPATAAIIKNNKVLHLALVWYFAGELQGKRAYWNNDEPEGGHDADHSARWYGFPRTMHVSKKLSPIDMCACLLFELINSKVDNEYEKLGTKGLTRREFAVNCVRSEFEAAKLTRLFFQVIPIDGAKVRMDDKYIEYVLGYGEFEAYLSWCDQLDDTQYNPVKYYGEVYDNYDSTRNEISANTNELLNTTRELLKSIREMVEE